LFLKENNTPEAISDRASKEIIRIMAHKVYGEKLDFSDNVKRRTHILSARQLYLQKTYQLNLRSIPKTGFGIF
jgi:hypothetical protein